VTDPMPLMLTLVAPATDHVNVLLCPVVIASGLAANASMVGGVRTAAIPPPPPPPQLANAQASAIGMTARRRTGDLRLRLACGAHTRASIPALLAGLRTC
jgi:hypothetical protein